MFSTDAFIDQFFSDKSVTRADCDAYTKGRFGGPVAAVQTQGRFSYTVTARDNARTIQFRERTKPSLEPTIASGLLSHTQGELVAPPGFVARLGGPSENGLDVYQMRTLSGVSCSDMNERLADDLQAMARFIDCLAKFFAQAWMRGRPAGLRPEDLSGLAEQCRVRLDAIVQSLPYTLLPIANGVRESIDRLFDGSYPIVLTHGDLSEMNMLLDDSSGALTGVIDWNETSLLPFGFALYALENALGGMYLRGWAYHDNAAEMRKRFWDTFNALARPSRAQQECMKGRDSPACSSGMIHGSTAGSRVCWVSGGRRRIPCATRSARFL